MAVHLSKIKNGVRIAFLVFVAFSAANKVAIGQGLADPTRPPAVSEPVSQQGATVPEGPQLQSVLISPTRRVATISGQSVMLGEKFGEARVVKITENEVVLRNGQDVQVLKLFPDVQKNTKTGRAGSSVETRKK